MTDQREKIELTSEQADELFHDTIDIISRHGCFSGPVLRREENGEWAMELTAISLDDDSEIEVVAQIYVRGTRLKEYMKGKE